MIDIGLDIHGVIDKYPDIFAQLTKEWVKEHRIHIITGQSWEEAYPTVQECGISFTDHFSVVDHHRWIGTKMWDDDSRGKGYWMDRETWLKTKGQYAAKIGLDIHFDDTPQYFDYFPESCKQVIVTDELSISSGLIDTDLTWTDLILG